MPIKTNYLGLDKLQTNEYYNSDIENANLDKIDDKLKNHEERTVAIEDQVYKKDRLSLELTSSNSLLSVTDTVDGICDFEIEGTLRDNIVANWYEDFLVDSGGTLTLKDTSIWDDGSKALKVIQKSHESFNYFYLNKSETYPYTQSGKYYIVHARVKIKNNNNLTAIDIRPNAGFGGIKTKYVDISKPNIEQKSIVVFESIQDLSHMPIIAIGFTTYNNEGTSFEFTDVQMSEITKDEYDSVSTNDISMDYLALTYPYVEELQPTHGILIESIGKNLANENNGLIDGYYISSNGSVIKDINSFYDTKYYPIVNRKTYTLSSNTNKTNRLCIYDSNKNFIKRLSSSNSPIGFTAEFDGFVRYVFSPLEKGTIMLVEDENQPEMYMQHQTTKIVIDDPLAKLPNGIKDKIIRSNVQSIKYANTNVGRDGCLHEIKDNDVHSIISTPVNVDYVLILKPESFIGYNSASIAFNNAFRIMGYSNMEDIEYDKISNIGKIGSSGNLMSFVLVVRKGRYATVEEAKADLVGYKLCYQLVEPTSINLTNLLESLNSYDKYTCYKLSNGLIENEKANLYEALTSYHLNRMDLESKLKYKVHKIHSVTHDGRNIMNLGNFHRDSYSYGNERWEIQKTEVQNNNIDINNIEVNYSTIGCSGISSTRITYNGDISSAVSSNSIAINSVSEQLDKNTETVNRLGKSLNWIEPTLLNGWRNRGVNDHTVQYAKDSLGWVHIRGTVVSGTLGETLFRLPEGFRPTKTEYVGAISAKENSYMYILATGEVTLHTGSSIWYDVSYSYYVGV